MDTFFSFQIEHYLLYNNQYVHRNYDTYNFDWSYEVFNDILSDLYANSQKHQNKADKVVGDIWFFSTFTKREGALDFLTKTGRIFSESGRI